MNKQSNMKSFITIFLLATCLFAVSASCKTKKQHKTKATAVKQADSIEHMVPPTPAGARKDIKKNQLKYYAFGIAAPSRQFIATMQSKYKITVISGGCVVNDDLLGYNAVVDSFMRAKYHKGISDIQMESRSKQ